MDKLSKIIMREAKELRRSVKKINDLFVNVDNKKPIKRKLVLGV